MAQAIITPSRRLIVGPRGFRKPARPVLDVTDPINRGTLGRWLLGDASGNGLYRDIGPLGLNGTGHNSPTLAGSHHGGLSNSFANGSSQYIDLGNPAALALGGSTPFSILYWIKVTAFNDSWQAVIAKGDTTWRSTRSISSNNMAFDTGSGGGASTLVGTVNVNDGKWHQIVCAWLGPNSSSAGNGTKQLWTDGKLDVTQNVANLSYTAVGTHVAIGSNLDFGRYWNGKIEDVWILGRALSAAEVARLYAEPYAGIYEAGPRWRVGVAAAGGTFNPGWASGATRTIGVGVF